VRIHERYGDKAMEVLNERPFELCDISGFGFKTGATRSVLKRYGTNI